MNIIIIKYYLLSQLKLFLIKQIKYYLYPLKIESFSPHMNRQFKLLSINHPFGRQFSDTFYKYPKYTNYTNNNYNNNNNADKYTNG